MFDFASWNLDWPTAFAIVGSIGTIVATLTAGWVKIATARKGLPKDNTKEVEGIRRELRAMDRDIADLQAAFEGKVDVKVDALQTQINDLKGHFQHLRQKIEKLTNIIIEHFSDRQP